MHGRNLLAVLSQAKFRIVTCLSVRYQASDPCFLLQNRICRFCLQNKAYAKTGNFSTREERLQFNKPTGQEYGKQ